MPGQVHKWVRNTLMLVIAAGVLVPAVIYGWRYAGDLSKQRTCVHNLKVMGEACKMYQSDWHDVLVPYGAPFAWPPKGKFWTDLLEPYVRRVRGIGDSTKSLHIAECPSFREERWGNQLYIDSGMNAECGGWIPGGKPVVVPLRSVRYPETTVRFAEEDWKAQGASYLAAKPSDFDPDDPTCHMFAARHMGKGNVLWIDGHVSSMTQEQYNMRDKGPYDGNVWLRLEGPKPPVP